MSEIKKSLKVFGLLLLVLSIMIPILNVHAKEISYITTDFYLADVETEKVQQIDISGENSTRIKLVKEAGQDKQIEIVLPDGINLNQEKTQELNVSENVQIIYSEQLNNIILSYDKENTDESTVSLELDKSDEFTEGKVTAEAKREQGVVTAENLKLVNDGIVKDEESVAISKDKENVADVLDSVPSTNSKERKVASGWPTVLGYLRDHEKTIQVGEGDIQTIPGEYGFVPKVSADTKVEIYIHGEKTEVPSDNKINIKKQEAGEDTYITYSNVGFYKGKEVDLRYVIDELPTDSAFFGLDTSKSVVSGSNINSTAALTISAVAKSDQDPDERNNPATIKFQFFDHNNPTERMKVKGYYTFVDFDNQEFVGVGADANLLNFYTLSNSEMDYAQEDEFILMMRPGGSEVWPGGDPGINGGISAEDQENWGSFTHGETDEITFEMNAVYERGADHGSTIGYTDATLVPIDYPEPIKTGDTAESDLTDQKIEYKLMQQVPERPLNNAEPQFEMYDIVDDCLVIDDVRIERYYQTQGKDNYFNINIDEESNKVTAKATSKALLDQKFYGQIYILVIETHLDPDSSWDAYYDKETNTITVPNVGHTKVVSSDGSDHILTSNTATGVIPVDFDFSIDKQIYNATGENITGAPGKEVGVDDIVTYSIVVSLDYDLNPDIGEILIKDNLQEGLEYIPGSTVVNGRIISPDSKIWNDDFTQFEVKVPVENDLKNITVSFKTKVLNSATKNGIISNSATAELASDNESKKETDVITNPVREPEIDPELKIVKKDYDEDGTDITGKPGAKVAVGDIVTYEITVGTSYNFDEGVYDELELKVIDELESGILYQKETTAIDGTHVNDAEVWDNDYRHLSGSGIVKDDEREVVVTFDTEVTSEAIDRGYIVNTANARLSDTMNRRSKPIAIDKNSEEIMNPLLEIDDLESYKTVMNSEGEILDEAQIGDIVYYEIVVKNIGDTDAKDVVISDTLEDTLMYQEGTTTMNGDFMKDTDVWDINKFNTKVDIKSGESVSFRFGVKVLGANDEGRINNIALVKIENIDGEENPSVSIPVGEKNVKTQKLSTKTDENSKLPMTGILNVIEFMTLGLVIVSTVIIIGKYNKE